MDRDRPIAAVLAGGEGRRIGGAKPALRLGGMALLEHPLRAAAAGGLEAIVVAKRATALPPLAAPIVLEPAWPTHPLCGVVAALEYAEQRERTGVLLLACDMPFLTSELLTWLATRSAPAMTVLGGREQPLPSLCPVAALGAMSAALAREQPLRKALASLSPELIGERELGRFGEPEMLFFNVNDARSLRAAGARLASTAS